MEKNKPKRFTNEFKAKVINEYLEGKGGRRFLAKKYGIRPSTIKYWLDTRDKNGKLKEDKRKTHSGRLKKEPTIDDYKERYEILKKIPSLLRSTTKEKIIFINLHLKEYKLSNLCAALPISKRTYYKYRDREDKDYRDYILIKQVFDNSKGTYGYRRIEEGLKIEYGVIFNHKKIARIMKKYSLKPEYIKRIKNTGGYKRIEENVRPNLVKRNFNTEKKNQIWCTDVTYLIFGNKRAYLSTIIDLYDRRVVAYKISRFNNLQFVIETLNEAIQKEGNFKGLILHSDQGSQYTSNQYKEICLANGIQISMSKKGTPIDDSPMESWHGILHYITIKSNH